MKRSRFYVAAIVVLMAGCSKPANPTDSLNAFFHELSQNQVDEAYDSTAFGFQTSLNRRTFARAVAALNIHQPGISYSWSPKSTSSSEVDLEGTISYPNGKKLPVSADLIDERGSWRVFRLRAEASQGDIFALVKQSPEGQSVSFSGDPRRIIPSEKDLQNLVEGSLMDFNRAIQTGNFASFYQTISLAWQDQITPKRLKDAFQNFVDLHVNLGNLNMATPVFDVPPEISSDGVLLLQGHYPSAGAKPYFTLRYKYELPHWKLYGLDVQIRQ